MAETQSTRSTLRGKIFLWLAWIFGVSVVGAIVVLFFGQVTGEEFNPYTLANRSFHYYQIPGLQVQVSAIRRDETKSEFGQTLIDNGLVKAKQKDEWHLVWASVSEGSRERGDASILTRYIDTDLSTPLKNWSLKNPKSAAKFWPVALRVARRSHYLLIPDLMDLAAKTTDDKLAVFSKELNYSLVEQYLRAAKIQKAGGNEKGAAELVDYAQSYSKGNEELESLVSDFKDEAE